MKDIFLIVGLYATVVFFVFLFLLGYVHISLRRPEFTKYCIFNYFAKKYDEYLSQDFDNVVKYTNVVILLGLIPGINIIYVIIETFLLIYSIIKSKFYKK